MQNSSILEDPDGNVRTALENNITNGCATTSCGVNEGKRKEQQHDDLVVISFEDRRGTDDSDSRETVENTGKISLTGKMNIQRSHDDSNSICRNSEHINTDETDDKKVRDTKETSRLTWSPPDASYRLKRYQNEPMKIENYEPGMSSIVLQDPFINNYYNPPIEKPGEHCKYTENNPNMKYEIRKADRTQSLTETSVRDHYRKVQKGGDIPLGGLRCPIPPIKAHRSSMTQKNIKSNVQTSLDPSSPKDTSAIISTANESSKTDRRPHSASAASTSTYVIDRRTKDELSAARKRELEIALAEARRKRLQEEAESNRARRHCDYFHSPHGNSPVALNRYDFDDVQFGSGSLPTSPLPVERPFLKARALYTFKAQTNRELSLNKGDTVYILRLIDRNWYEGQRHGTVGIFPVDYVEVLESYHDLNCKDVGNLFVAKFDFVAKYPSEISFQKGDVLRLIHLVDDNWYEATIGSRSGLVPKSYVEPLQYRLTVPLTIPVGSSSTEISQHDSPGTMSSTSSCLSSGIEPPLLTSSRNLHGSEWNACQYVSNSHSLNTEADLGGARNKSTMQHPDLVGPFQERSNSPGAFDHTAADPQLDHFGDAITPFWQYHHPDTSEDDLDFQGIKSVEHQSAVATDAYYTTEQRYGAIEHCGNDGFLPYIVCQALYSYAPLDDDELELLPGDIINVTEIFDDGWYVGVSRRTKTYGTFPGNYVQRLRVFHPESSTV